MGGGDLERACRDFGGDRGERSRRGIGDGERLRPFPRRYGGGESRRPESLYLDGGGEIDSRFTSPRRGGGLLESERPLRRGGGEEERYLLRGVSGSNSESDAESESDESDESESEESDDDEDSASSIARRFSIMSLGAFCK